MALARRDRAAHFAMSVHRNLHNEPLEWNWHFYLLDILMDPSPVTVIMSAVQTGKSEIHICKVLADASLGLSCFYVLPIKESRDIFVQNRVNRLLVQSDEYKVLLDHSLGDANSCRLKHFGGGVIRFGASESIREFKEFPSDVLYVDEYDVCNMDGIRWAFDRCKGSTFRFQHYISNPTLPGADFRPNIAYKYTNSDQKRLHYACPKCKKVQTLRWFENIVEEVRDGSGVALDYRLRDADWSPSCGRDIDALCSKCGTPLPRDSSCVGWIPVGDPKHPVSGYQISRLACPLDELAELYDRFVESTGNSTKLQVFVNSDLGSPYEGGTGDRITEGMVASCVENYRLPGPGEVFHSTTAGIDVGAAIDVRISQPFCAVNEAGRSVPCRRLIKTAKCKTWAEVRKLLIAYRTAVAVIDAYPEVRAAKDFQEDMKQAGVMVWRCSYYPTQGTNPRKVRWDKKAGNMVWIDRTESMDAVFGAIQRKEEIFPPIYKELNDGRWLKEMLAPIRVEDRETKRYSWAEATDHAFHCDGYDLLACQSPNSGWGVRGSNVIRGKRAPDFTEAPAGARPKLNRYRNLVRSRLPTWREVSG